MKKQTITNLGHIINYKFESKLRLHRMLKFDKTVKLSDKVDLRIGFNRVYDQGNLGSCVANATLALYEYDKPDFDGSRLFLYYNARKIDGNTSEDAGSYISSGIKSMVNDGVCNEKLWSYDTNKFAIEPTKECYENALNHQVLDRNQIDQNINDMKACVNSGEPFAFGMILFDSFQNIGKDGNMKLPKNGEDILGGHAVTCVGYNDKKSHFIVRNSWSKDWGDNGYFYVPYDFFKNKNVFDDLWKVTKVEG